MCFINALAKAVQRALLHKYNISIDHRIVRGAILQKVGSEVFEEGLNHDGATGIEIVVDDKASNIALKVQVRLCCTSSFSCAVQLVKLIHVNIGAGSCVLLRATPPGSPTPLHAAVVESTSGTAIKTEDHEFPDPATEDDFMEFIVLDICASNVSTGQEVLAHSSYDQAMEGVRALVAHAEAGEGYEVIEDAATEVPSDFDDDSDVSESESAMCSEFISCFKDIDPEDPWSRLEAAINFQATVSSKMPELKSNHEELLVKCGVPLGHERHVAAALCSAKLHDLCLKTLDVYKATSAMASNRQKDVTQLRRFKSKVMSLDSNATEVRAHAAEVAAQLQSRHDPSHSLMLNLKQLQEDSDSLRTMFLEEGQALQKFLDEKEQMERQKLEGLTADKGKAEEEVIAAEEKHVLAGTLLSHSEALGKTWKAKAGCVKKGLLVAGVLAGIAANVVVLCVGGSMAAVVIIPLAGAALLGVLAGFGYSESLHNDTQARLAREIQNLLDGQKLEKEPQRISAEELLSKAKAAVATSERKKTEALETLKYVSELREMQVRTVEERTAALNNLQQIFSEVGKDLQATSGMAATMECILQFLVERSDAHMDGMSLEDDISEIRQYVQEELTDEALSKWKTYLQKLRFANERLLDSVIDALQKLHSK